MRIGIVTTWFERGAAIVSRQYRDVLATRHDVRIYGRGGDGTGRGDPRWDDGTVTWARDAPTHGDTAFDLGHFRRWIRRERIEAILFNEQQWWAPVLLATDLGVRTAAYVDYYTAATVPLFDNYDLLLCNTRRHASVFEDHPGCRFAPWGTDPSVFRPGAAPARGDGPTFFHSAGMNPYRKGTDLVLDAFAAVQPPAHLVIHAQVNLLDRLPASAPTLASLVDAGHVTLESRTVPAPGLYHLGDVYVYPTRLEGIGLTIAEALACGLPAIVPDVPPMNEFVPEDAGKRVEPAGFRPRADGYYWPECHVRPEDLSVAMQAYVDRYAEIDTFRRAARTHAETNLDWARNAADVAGWFENIPAADPARRASARRAALQYERGRQDVRLYYPTLSRVLLRAADVLRPLASRYSGRQGDDV